VEGCGKTALLRSKDSKSVNGLAGTGLEVPALRKIESGGAGGSSLGHEISSLAVKDFFNHRWELRLTVDIERRRVT
jgi:hypothetical protein